MTERLLKGSVCHRDRHCPAWWMRGRGMQYGSVARGRAAGGKGVRVCARGAGCEGHHLELRAKAEAPRRRGRGAHLAADPDVEDKGFRLPSKPD